MKIEKLATDTTGSVQSLNPCSYGMKLNYGITGISTQRQKSLNPCSYGMMIEQPGSHQGRNQKLVLILIIKQSLHETEKKRLMS